MSTFCIPVYSLSIKRRILTISSTMYKLISPTIPALEKTGVRLSKTVAESSRLKLHQKGKMCYTSVIILVPNSVHERFMLCTVKAYEQNEKPFSFISRCIYTGTIFS